MDDFSFLRYINDSILQKEAHIFKIKDALMYNEDESRKKDDNGSSFWRAENPPFGAVFTYFLKETYETKKEKRKDEEKKFEKEGKPLRYPTLEELTNEYLEQPPSIIFQITDELGNVIRNLTSKPLKGLNRISWDLRYSDLSPTDDTVNINTRSGMAVVPGNYFVQMFKNIDGKLIPITDRVPFQCKVLNNVTLPAENRKNLVDFQRKVAKLQNATLGTLRTLLSLQKRVKSIKNAFLLSPIPLTQYLDSARHIQLVLDSLEIKLNGNKTISRYNENQPPSVIDRLSYILSRIWSVSQEPTETQKKSYEIAYSTLKAILQRLQTLLEKDIKSLEIELDKNNAPWTPERFPKLD